MQVLLSAWQVLYQLSYPLKLNLLSFDLAILFFWLAQVILSQCKIHFVHQWNTRDSDRPLKWVFHLLKYQLLCCKFMSNLIIFYSIPWDTEQYVIRRTSGHSRFSEERKLLAQTEDARKASKEEGEQSWNWVSNWEQSTASKQIKPEKKIAQTKT